MNLLILFSQPWRVGGAETHVEALLKGLAADRVFLAVNEGSDEIRLQELARRYPKMTLVKIQARGMNVCRWRSDIKKLAALIKAEEIEVIAAQQRTAGIWAYFLHKSTQIPYTVTMHDPWHRAKFKAVYPKLFPVIFAVSQNLAAVLRADFGFAPGQIRLINNGIDFSEFVPAAKAAAREKLGLAPDDKIILHVSRLSRIKGEVSLKIIGAMEAVCQAEPKAKLVIIGEGPLRGEINRQAEAFNEKYEDRIHVRDFVCEIRDWYNAADILIGEGRVAMETLACERPIVAIRNGVSFIGAIRAANIAYACDVNFDGKDQRVTGENLAAAVVEAMAVPASESAQIGEYIKSRLSLEKMTADYRQVFAEITQHN